MRTAVTSVGAVLDDIEHGLHVSSSAAGLITTLPVICFAGVGAMTPRLAGRFSVHRLLVVALVLMTLGLALRATVANLGLFVVLSLVALVGGAVANITLPIIVKRDFPDRIGRMTALYTTALAVGTTAGAGLTVPVGDLADGWRFGLGSWAVLSALAVLPWLTMLRNDVVEPMARGRWKERGRHSPTPIVRSAHRAITAAELVRSRTAWALTVFFAAQSFQAYVGFGWFADFLHDHGHSKSAAGYLVAVMAGLSIPVSMIAPTIPARRHRALVGVLALAYLVAYLGLAIAPNGGALAWMVLAGIGSGMFPLALTLIGLRARTAATTGVLSAFVQSIGYIVAGTGPLLFGVLHDAAGGWGLPLVLLFVALAVALVSGWLATGPYYVDDEVGRAVGHTAG
jgi:MFS transporter, CP family, cyanate transporter